MRISEPMTVCTDLALAAISAVFAWQLLKLQGTTGRQDLGFWAGSFLWVTFAALTGAARHGFSRSLDELGNNLLLKGTLLFLCLATYNLLEATVRSGLSHPQLAVAVAVNGFLFFVCLLSVFGNPGYGPVAAYYTIALITLLAVHWDNRYLAASAGLSLTATLLWLVRVSPHPSFNQNDLYHVLQVPALWLLYKGVRSFMSILPVQ